MFLSFSSASLTSASLVTTVSWLRDLVEVSGLGDEVGESTLYQISHC